MNDIITLPESTDPAEIWFTADQHFGHENIIKYTDRPYANAAEMDENLVRLWNQSVGPNDYVFHLGDFTLGGAEEARRYFKQLNGKISILGLPWHHDKHWLMERTERHYFASYWPVTILSSQVIIEVSAFGRGGYPLIVHLNHYPMDTWDRSHYGSWHLYGHVHQYQNESSAYKINVGVDVTEFNPVNLWYIKLQMENKGWPISPLERNG